MSISADILRRARDGQYLHLYSKANWNFQLCLNEFLNYRYSEAILNCYEVMEFYWKSFHYLKEGTYPRHHLPDNNDFRKVESFLKTILPRFSTSRIRNIFSNYNPSWQTNPSSRMQPRYGDERTGRGAAELYNYKKANKMKNDCQLLINNLVKVHREIIQNQRDHKILIMNGKVSNSSKERKCGEYPAADRLKVNGWYKRLKKYRNVSVNRKPISSIDNSFSIVINPFGEAYPEKPNTHEMLPAFHSLCNYIFNGGILLTAGGLPFTYYWDVNRGVRENACNVVPNYTTGIIVDYSQTPPRIIYRVTTLLVNNLIQKQFNVMTTMDDPNRNIIGPSLIPIFQNDDDKKYWDYNQTGHQLHEFRSIDPAQSLSAIPVIRANRHGSEVWPIALIRYGNGLLIHIGLDLSNGNIEECNFALTFVNQLIQNYTSFF